MSTLSAPNEVPGTQASARVPTETLGALFVRFLRFGFLAWGGPIAQIAMQRRTIVE
jgi:chromate transporter